MSFLLHGRFLQYIYRQLARPRGFALVLVPVCFSHYAIHTEEVRHGQSLALRFFTGDPT